MKYEKFEDKYIPEFESEERAQAAIFAKAIGDWSMCDARSSCTDIKCSSCLLNDINCCIAYLKQHHECLENYLKTLKGEEAVENDLPKLRPGMAITFTDNRKLGFMTSETQIMYVYPHNNHSAIIEGWDLLGDQSDIEVPYSRIKAVYVSTDIVDIFTPCPLARMAEAVSNDEDPAKLEGVKLIWSRQEHKDMILSDRQLIHIYNRMPGVNKVVVNTCDEIETMFNGDVLEFYNRASKGNYNTDDTWIKLNGHGNLIAFTDITDSDIDIAGVRIWARDHTDEIKDILENK